MREQESFSAGIAALEEPDPVPPTINLSEIDPKHQLIGARREFVDLASRCSVFRRADGLVAVDAFGGDFITKPLKAEHVQGMLDRGVNWVRNAQGGSEYAVTAPQRLSRDILAVQDLRVRALEGLVRSPVYASDGRLIQKPGYDESSKLFYARDAELHIESVPETPTEEDVAKARSLLLGDLLGDFTFESQADRANALGILLTVLMRELFEGPSPLMLIEADRPGTGKTLLAKVLSIVVAGSESGVTDLPRNDDQIAKLITSALRRGDRFCVLDNLAQLLDAAPLAAVATSEFWKDRILHTSDMVKLVNRIVWVVTGNYVQVSADLARRCVPIVLAPREVGFDYQHKELESWAMTNRGRLVRAGLVLVANWLATGRSGWAATLPSYVPWSRVVGGALVSAGVEGFLENRDRHLEAVNLDRMAEVEFFEAWHRQYGSTPVYAGDLVSVAEDAELAQVRGRTGLRSRQTALGHFLSRAVEFPTLLPPGWRVLSRQVASTNQRSYALRPDASRAPRRAAREGLIDVPDMSGFMNSPEGERTGTSGTSGTSPDSDSSDGDRGGE